MLDSLIDALLDTLKILPYLFITFIILELLEHKLSNKNEIILRKNKKFGPFIGGLLGAIPQCGFSTMASSLFSSRVITIGTVIAIFLSTSDEMLPIMVSEKVDVLILLKIVGLKVLIGILVGIIVDFIFKDKHEKPHNHIHEMCHDEECHCESDGILLSSIKHTLKILIFVLIANILINGIIYFIGEDRLTKLLMGKKIITYFGASLIGLIPNCASSVIITKLYLANLITIGTLLAGLLTGSGLGILLLFRNNKNLKENLTILWIIYTVGVVVGILADMII